MLTGGTGGGVSKDLSPWPLWTVAQLRKPCCPLAACYRCASRKNQRRDAAMRRSCVVRNNIFV